MNRWVVEGGGGGGGGESVPGRMVEMFGVVFHTKGELP